MVKTDIEFPARATAMGRFASIWARVRPRFRRACPSGLSIDDLIDRAEATTAALLDFGQETDHEFTSLAGGLSELTGQLGRMKTQARELDDILHDRDSDRALSSAYLVCKGSIDLVHASLGVSHTMQLQMESVDASLGKACATREDFDKNYLLLRTLSMGFRVEASRVEAGFRSVFANVAGAIREIDEKIAHTTHEAFDRMQGMLDEAASERDTINAAEQALFAQATQSIAMVQAEIASMRRALEPCAGANDRIATLLTNADPLVVAVLRALQYQDIVRQKLEHVASGFRDIIEHRHDRVFLHRAAQLQHKHLLSSREEIERAGTEVVTGLQGLLGTGTTIDAELQGMEAAAVGALSQSKIAELFEREIRELAHIASSSEQANRRIAALVQRIEAMVEVFSREISRHEKEVKLVALNAQVAAARVPSAGALEKLAEETSMVSARNAHTTGDLTGRLRSILEMLRKTKAEADEFLSVITTEKGALQTGASEVGHKLTRHHNLIREQSSAVRVGFAAAHGGITSLLKEIRFPELIAGCFAPAVQLCRELAECTGDALETDTLTAEGAKRFHAHARRYTMDEERDAHAAVLGAAVVEPPPTPVAASAVDDIELFSEPAPSAASCVSITRSGARKPVPSAPVPSPEEAVIARGGASPNRPGAREDLGDGIELF